MLNRKNDAGILKKLILRIILSKKNVIKQKYNKKENCPYLDFGKISKNTKVKYLLPFSKVE